MGLDFALDCLLVFEVVDVFNGLDAVGFDAFAAWVGIDWEDVEIEVFLFLLFVEAVRSSFLEGFIVAARCGAKDNTLAGTFTRSGRGQTG